MHHRMPMPFVTQRGGGFLGDAWDFTRKHHLISSALGAAGTLVGIPGAGIVAGLAGSMGGFGKKRRAPARTRVVRF